MPIRIDDDWHYEGSSASRDRQVYRGSLLIGRVRRRQSTSEVGTLIRERFTVERWLDKAFIPIEGEQPSLEGALQRLVIDSD